MHDSHASLSASLQTGIGLFYFLVALMNLGFAAYHRYDRKDRFQAMLWTIVGGVFFLHAVVYLAHFGWPIFPWLQHGIDLVMNPVSYFVLASIRSEERRVGKEC